ncbi:hypothetical protein FBU31_001839 [Coemansia sp. 'formosensis']|nr:hypothetical protein FBU31_001839 [Coemansia sp. 'formosensis']
MQSVQSDTTTPSSRWFGSGSGWALLGNFRVAERVETYDHPPYHIYAGCMVFSDHNMQQPREEIRCQALDPRPMWFGDDTLVLLTDWRYISQPEMQPSRAASVSAFIEILSPPVLLPATITLSDIERPLSWWLKCRVYPELELEVRFIADMRKAPPLDNKTAANVLAHSHRRGNRSRSEDISNASSIFGRVSAVGSLMPTRNIDKDDSFGFLIDISIDSASTGGEQTPLVPVLLCGRRFLGLFASLGIGDSLFVSGLLAMPLHIEGADSASMFVTSLESGAYRISDFDGLNNDNVRLPMPSQLPYTQATQDSLLSRIAPSCAAADASGTPCSAFPNSQHSDSWLSSQPCRGDHQISQACLSQATVQKVESSDGHLLVHHNRVESYSGLITRVVDTTLGIYLVDDYHILMLTFWPLRSLMSVLRPGTRVLLDNMHVLLLANSKGYHWSWLKRIWPQSLDQSTPIDERRVLSFGACARSSVRIVEFADTADPGPTSSIISGDLASYVAKRTGGLVRMVETIEAFWRLQVKFPCGLGADSAISTAKVRDDTKIMDLALRLVGYPQSDTIGKPSSYRRADDPEMLSLEFSGQALVGHIYSWSHWRLTTELVNIAPVTSGIGSMAASAVNIFELLYITASIPAIIHADHNFGRSDEAGKQIDVHVAWSFLLLVHSQSPVVKAPCRKKSKSSSDGSSSDSDSGARAHTSWIAVKGAGLKIGYSDFHTLIESGVEGTDGDTLRVNINETKELLTCVVSYDPDQLPISLIPGCAYVVCVADPSMITHYNSSGKYIQIELQSSCHVHPACVNATDCSGSGCKPYVAMHHHELLAQASSGDKPLHIPTIQIDTANSKILDIIRPPPVYPVRELHSLLASMHRAGQQKDGASSPGDIVSVHGTITKRGIKQAVTFINGSPGTLRSGKKRSNIHSDSTGLLAGRFDTRIILRDDRDNESTVTLYIELSTFAHPLGLVPGTRVVVRDTRLEMAKSSGRAYLRGTVTTSFQAISAKITPDLVVQAPIQAIGDAGAARVSIGQLYGRLVNKVMFHCHVSAIEQLRIAVSCRECKQAVCEMLCACAGRRHKIAAKSPNVVVRIELLCRIADGSGAARLLVSDEAKLAETLGLSATEVTELFGVAAQSNEGQLLWVPQQEEQDIEADRIISPAAAALPAVALRVEGLVQREHPSHLDEHRQPLRLGGQSILAPKTEELRKCFNTEDVDEVIKEVLLKGEQQVSDKERHHQLDNMLRDIATVVAEKCVNPATQQPYTVTMIEKIMADIHYSVNPNRSAKQQALDVIKQIQEQNTVPISRAQMRIRISMPRKDAKRLREKLLELVATIEDEERDESGGEEYEQVCLIDPGQYRAITELVSGVPKGAGTVEILSLRDINDEDSTLN